MIRQILLRGDLNESGKTSMSRLTALSLVILLFNGCERNVYEIELEPQEGSLRREITFWREGTAQEESDTAPFPAEQLAKIAHAYDAAAPDAANQKHHFSGSFAGATPDDVGGAGWYTPMDSPMGSVGGYVERFRGTDDLALGLDQRLRAVDRLVNLVSEFLETETGDTPSLASLREFVKGELRRDVRNLCLYVWLYGVVGRYDQNTYQDLVVRLVHYLIERDYLDPGSVPAILRATDEAKRNNMEPLLNLVGRIAARKIGMPADQPVPEPLAAFFDEQRLTASFERFATQTDEYQKLLAEYEQQRHENPELSKPEPDRIFGDLLAQAFLPGFGLGTANNMLTVRMKLPREPFATNGKWDASAASVAWSRHLPDVDSDRHEFPAVLYAFWATAREDYQKQHFGRVVLEGEDLAHFCLWYCGLSKSEAAIWDRFVDGLGPGSDLVDRIKRFTFPGEQDVKDPESPPPSLADRAKSLLLKSLDGEASSPSQPQGASHVLPKLEGDEK